MKRDCKVCGSLYSKNPKELAYDLFDMYKKLDREPSKLSDKRIVAGNVPHAHYGYSGDVAFNTFKTIFDNDVPDTVIILGIDHFKKDENILMKEGKWCTPFGCTSIDEEVADSLLKDKTIQQSNSFIDDDEHSIEVQIPFIQYLSIIHKKPVKIVPVLINSQDEKTLDSIGTSISNTIKEFNDKNIVVVSSNDISHESPKHFQDINDKKLIDIFENNNWTDVLDAGVNYSSCNPQGLALIKNISSKLNADKVKTLQYKNSGGSDYAVSYYSGVIYDDKE